MFCKNMLNLFQIACCGLHLFAKGIYSHMCYFRADDGLHRLFNSTTECNSSVNTLSLDASPLCHVHSIPTDLFHPLPTTILIPSVLYQSSRSPCTYLLYAALCSKTGFIQQKCIKIGAQKAPGLKNMAFRQSKLIDVNRIKAAYSIVGSSILFFASSSLPRMAKIQAEEVVGRCWEPHVYTSHAKFCHM